MYKLFGKVLAGATVSLALFAWTSQAEAFHHRWHGSGGGSSGGWGSSGGSSGGWGGSSGSYGGSSGGWGGSSGGSSGGGGWHHGRHKHWRGGSSGGSSGGWGSSGGSSGGWGGSSGGSSGGSYYYSPMTPGVIDPSTVPPPGAPVAPAPGTAPPPAGGVAPPGTSTGMSKSDGLLTVSVPEDAKIFVNGQQTSSTGAARQYVSRDLAGGYNYAYEVRAEVVRDGKTIEQVKTVNVRSGETASLAFDFPTTESSETSLTVHVPADAKVFLAGNATKASGETRVFRTTGLAGSKAWEGYTVRVELERGGRVVTKEETISLKAGESRELRFDFEGDKVAQAR